uniref:CYTH domain-containing protein n=1 Tax=Clandestinovirus TaxID=2831644 RepID=A0A8F8KLZ6_9VIRU|nr:hypothetical protein KOM_12_601 [Clandestinovirus]
MSKNIATHHYIALDTQQFIALVNTCSNKVPKEYSDLYYDNDENDLLSKGWILRKRDGTYTLHKIHLVSHSSVEYEIIQETDIHVDLGQNWEDKYRVLVALLDVKRVVVDEEFYIEEVHLSRYEYYLVGIKHGKRDEGMDLETWETESKKTMRAKMSDYQLTMYEEPARNKLAEFFYGFEIEIYADWQKKGFVKDGPNEDKGSIKYMCSRSKNRPRESAMREFDGIQESDKFVHVSDLHKYWDDDFDS